MTRHRNTPPCSRQALAGPSVKAGIAAFVTVLLLPTGCGLSTPGSGQDETAQAAAPPEGGTRGADTQPGVTLTSDEVEALGVVTTEAQALRQSREASGFGVVLGREPFAQGLAELRTAQAAQHQSQAALSRIGRLSGTPGAMPAQSLEDAERQAAADTAAFQLARQRLQASFGQDAPWKDPGSSPQAAAVAAGRLQLVRVTFPLGMLTTDPRQLRLAPLDAGIDARAGTQGDARAAGWTTHLLWRAPADSTVPGRSYFALLPASEAGQARLAVGEGERLLAFAPQGEPQAGVLVPAAAAVITGGRYYCYVETAPGRFARIPIDPSRSSPEGYFADDGIAPGARIVTQAAGQLLARELNPSREAE